MTNEEAQAIMKSTFGNLTIFSRDVDLDEKLISKYQPNQILMERGFTDVTHKIGGFGKNCRYLVASSKGKDLSMFGPKPELGHIVIHSGAFFKVLDIQKKNGKTQILILHIPPEGVEIFSRAKVDAEDQIIEKGIEIFNKVIDSKPVGVLQAKDWVDRTSFPIGMNQEGVFFMDMLLAKNVESKSSKPSANPQTFQKKADNPKSEDKSKEEKKGFWRGLFGK